MVSEVKYTKLTVDLKPWHTTVNSTGQGRAVF